MLLLLTNILLEQFFGSRSAHLLFYWFKTQVSQRKRPILCIDDTKAFKPHAKKIPNLSWHADHHHLVKTQVKTQEGEELTATGVVGYKGHCWVVLAALHKIKPGKWCCFPILGDIFVREKDTQNFRTKLEIAQELVGTLNYPLRPLLVGDNFYSAKGFVNQIEADVLSLLKSNAVAFEPAPETDIRRRGQRLWSKSLRSSISISGTFERPSPASKNYPGQRFAQRQIFTFHQ